MRVKFDEPRVGQLLLIGWEGDSRQRVLVIGHTPAKWWIRAPGPETVKLAGRARYLAPGEETLVPKHAVRFDG